MEPLSKRRQLVEVVDEDPGVLLPPAGVYASPLETDVTGYHIIAGAAVADQPGTLILYWGRLPGTPLFTTTYALLADPIIPGIFRVQVLTAGIVGQVIPMPFVSVGFVNLGPGAQTVFDLYVEARQES